MEECVMPSSSSKRAEVKKPDELQLTESQLSRLSKLTNLDAKTIGKGTVAQVAERLKWLVDPHLFWFERICGRVVKRDPITGIDYPVPYATVHIQDTDCSFLGLFPID